MNKFFSLFLILLVLFELSFVYTQGDGICCWTGTTLGEGNNENCGDANEDGADDCSNSRQLGPFTCGANCGTGSTTGSETGCNLCTPSGDADAPQNLDCISSIDCECNDVGGCTDQDSNARGQGSSWTQDCTVDFGAPRTDSGLTVTGTANANACCAGTPYDSENIVCCNTDAGDTPILLDFGVQAHPISGDWTNSDQCCYNADLSQFEVWRAHSGAHNLACERGGNSGAFNPGNDPATGIDLCPDRTQIGVGSGLAIANDGLGIPNCNDRETTPCFTASSDDNTNLWNLQKTYDYMRNGDGSTSEGSRFGYQRCATGGNSCRDLLYDADHCSGCGNACSTGAAPNNAPNAGESQVKDYCSVGLCPCETGCSTSTGYHIKRYARCAQQQFSDEFLSWTSEPVSEQKETGGAITQEFGSDPWPPQPGSPRTWFPYEDNLDGKTHDGVEPYGIWWDYSADAPRMTAETWNDFADDWWGHCPVDFLKSPYHCISTTSPSGSPIYDSGDESLPASYNAYNLDQDSALANACETDCRGNVPMLPCLKKCNRFNQHFRKVVAKARAADFAAGNQWQQKLEELCSACHPDNTDIVPDPKIPHNYCCENTIECALYTTACEINGEKLVQSWANGNEATYKFSALPCDDRSPVLPGVYRDKSNRCGESDTDRFRPVHESFGLRHTHIPIKLSTTADNIGVIVSRDNELRPYGAGFAGELGLKTFDFACVADVESNGPSSTLTCSIGGESCIDIGGGCDCGNTAANLATNCYRYCNYGSKRTCYSDQEQQDWNTEMIHLIFDPEVSDPDVILDKPYTAHIESANSEWTISVSDYKDCVDEPNSLTATDPQTINFLHTTGHAYVITAIFIGDETDPNHDKIAKVYIKPT